ncbi:hypothetical protein GALMADRAFT_221522 [Galerina marginata CBS 339.88]|uniref:Chromosome segregation in meiosis protein n=1 Tax=Galerina marginata (strain CBS 339.88) TaxID=685588 RepID=A0A067TER8_GALM3|nr:hypothetical protein GALMADRAFT_221522 [Galerina marginata CBS 339.88]
MDSSLDNIWDEPAVQNSPKRLDRAQDTEDDAEISHRPAKRPRQTLFLADSDDEVDISAVKVTHKAPPAQDVDIDALFAEFDDADDDLFKPLPPRVDEAELVRQAQARVRNMPALTPHEILPSSSPPRDTEDTTDNKKSGAKDKDKDKDEKKARRRLVKLDENRLLGPNGFPQLIKMTKDFKIKGKGHEATDLNRLLQTYQYWTHQLYPKTQFRDTVERVEKLCHSRRMNVSLSVWRDDAHGRPNKKNDDSDDEDMRGGDDEGRENDENMNAEDRDASLPLPGSSPTHISSRATSLPVSGLGSDIDMPTRLSHVSTVSQFAAPPGEDEDTFWRSMDEFSGHSSDPPPAPTTAANSSMDEDEDMWDIIDEVERSSADKSTAPSTTTMTTNSTATEPPGNQADPDDWDDMYL